MRHVRIAEAVMASPTPPHSEFLGVSFCLLSQNQVIKLILGQCGEPFRYVVTPNAYHIALIHDDPDRMLPAYRGAWLSLCDSRILRALAAFDGRALPLVTGSDLVEALLSALDARDVTRLPQQILVVGSDHSAEAKLRRAYPNVTIEVLPAPKNLEHDSVERLAVARACMDRHWDILLLCVGCPAQELIAHQLAVLGRTSGIALCVGASVDFLTGARARAPRWVQKLSLEWAYRLAREPGRLWYRYLVESPKVLRLYLKARSSRGADVA
jgi:N-acetylglucosaminyldiphosphoundecaprenol N-acetyl-beta-D-mannosaminyltransferase